MCGIAGIYSFNGREIRNLEERIGQMTNYLVHRGPDGRGIFVDPKMQFALSNTRLAISDPISTLQQPLMDVTNDSFLTFNGEIFNDLELREDLISSGRRFGSNQDTEILLQGMVAEGEPFLQKIDGMWAFAFYDGVDKSLLLSRDLLGERQLFYKLYETEIVFASEVPPLLADSDMKNELDFQQVLHSLRLGVPEPGHTLIGDIRKLNAGHNLKVNQNGEWKEYRHTRLHPEKWLDYFQSNPDLDSVVANFNDIFFKSCMRRVPRDVPFMSTLSGGLDSALVSINSSGFGKRKIDTIFGWSYSTESQDMPFELSERAASYVTSDFIGSKHHEVQLDTEESIEVLEGVASNSYDGMLEEATAPFEMLARYGNKFGKKVMLLSDGPDELLGGYPGDARHYLNNSEYCSWENFSFIPNHQTNAPSVLGELFEGYDYKDYGIKFGRIHPDYSVIGDQLDVSQLMALSYASYTIPDYNNLRTDRGFMRASVECRSPFLAPEMVEFMVAMPGDLRFGNGRSTKWLMRRIIGDILGDKIAKRTKHGFSEPLWFAPAISKALQFEEVLNSSPLLNLMPFSKKFLDAPFAPPFHKIRWSIFSLTKMHHNLTNCRF